MRGNMNVKKRGKIFFSAILKEIYQDGGKKRNQQLFTFSVPALYMANKIWGSPVTRFQLRLSKRMQ